MDAPGRAARTRAGLKRARTRETIRVARKIGEGTTLDSGATSRRARARERSRVRRRSPRRARARANARLGSTVVRSFAVERARARNKNEIIDVRVGGKATARSGRRDPAGALTTSMSLYFRARSSSPTRRVRRRACIRSRACIHSLRLFVSRRRTAATGPSVGFHIYSAIGGTIHSQCAYKDGTSTHVPYSIGWFSYI